MKWMDNRYGGELQENKHPALASEESRSTGLEEDCEGGQGPPWTIAPE